MQFGKANVPDQGGNNIFELVFLVTLGTNETNLTIKGSPPVGFYNESNRMCLWACNSFFVIVSALMTGE